MTRAAGPARVPFDAWYAAHRDPVDAVADAAADLRAELVGAAGDAAVIVLTVAAAVLVLPPLGDAAAAGIAGYVALDRLVDLTDAGRLLHRRRDALAAFRAGAIYDPPPAGTAPALPTPTTTPTTTAAGPAAAVPVSPAPAGPGRSASWRTVL